jgi:dTDP-4-dehydrorhamnose reductase
MECTINRVDSTYFDQLKLSGHLERIEDDMRRFAELGLRCVRTCLHWERFAEAEAAGRDPWVVFDRTMNSLRGNGMEPIVGLLHHGSGPPSTSLLDADFGEKLADYALRVAERYPWATLYTPVNEPNTTARFSCLYGHWFPHHESLASYARALVNQAKATALAMQAIRTVQPEARLITTEDGGRIGSTGPLQAEREHREARRWLGTDLLCGWVAPGHSLFAWLVQNGIAEDELRWLAEHPCPPHVLGLNYYLTSDRFLDHRTELYPSGLAGGDTGDQPFVDIEALRVDPVGLSGSYGILMDAWRRYGIPLAITECHSGDSKKNQVRWLTEMWEGAQQARAAGAEVVALTAWALLGSFNWSCLCTEDIGVYEPGVFTLRTKTKAPKPTALAEVVRKLASGERGRGQPGAARGDQPVWWREDARLLFPAP